MSHKDRFNAKYWYNTYGLSEVHPQEDIAVRGASTQSSYIVTISEACDSNGRRYLSNSEVAEEVEEIASNDVAAEFCPAPGQLSRNFPDPRSRKEEDRTIWSVRFQEQRPDPFAKDYDGTQSWQTGDFQDPGFAPYDCSPSQWVTDERECRRAKHIAQGEAHYRLPYCPQHRE